MASNFYKAGAAAMTSNKDDWETPQSLFDQLTRNSTSLSMPPQTTRTQNANTTTQSKTVA